VLTTGSLQLQVVLVIVCVAFCQHLEMRDQVAGAAVFNSGFTINWLSTAAATEIRYSGQRYGVYMLTYGHGDSQFLSFWALAQKPKTKLA